MSVLLLTPEFGNKNSELSNGRLTVYLPVFKYLENVYKISGYVSRGSLRLLEEFSTSDKISVSTYSTR